MRYTIVQLYQPIPLPCIQSVQLLCNQTIPELNMYLQKKTDTRLVVLQPTYVRALYVMQPTYVCALTIMQPTFAF